MHGDSASQDNRQNRLCTTFSFNLIYAAGLRNLSRITQSLDLKLYSA